MLSNNISVLLGQRSAPTSPADLNSDGVVDGADLLILLNLWGPVR